MNKLAKEINLCLDKHISGKLLSALGKRMYFPQGIVAQAEQSKNAKIKATAGMALEHTIPIMLSAVQEQLPLKKATDIVAYSPVAGIPALRDTWQEHQIAGNPSLNADHISRPIVCNGLTHGIHIIVSLFVDSNDVVLTQEYIWDNYEHILETFAQANIQRIPMFDTTGNFQAAQFKQYLEKTASEQGKIILLLNFPNNPTGQCLLEKDANKLCDQIKNIAKKDIPIVLLCDDAYFPIFYDDNIFKTSLFSQLASLHKNILAIKIDGATKELCAWGLRVGFITFGNPELSDEIKQALEKKITGSIRSVLTSCSRISQSLVLDVLQHENTENELHSIFHRLREKYQTVKSALTKTMKQHPSSPLTPLYFNGGYFMCFDCNSISADTLRLALLEQEKIALIQIDNLLRFTFASVDSRNISHILNKIYEHAQRLASS